LFASPTGIALAAQAVGGPLVRLTVMVELLMSATSLSLHHQWAAFISRGSL
jgi:hypothetical protein